MAEQDQETGGGGTGNAQPGPKTIVLFSDGTGNSSAKLFRTNVWRMYEAIELDAAGARQVVFYDEGVGNSGFKPLAALGGIFGWGLRRNVVQLYSFLCRNYEPGAHIYLFGFSRGAFTVRMLAGLIASQGVVDYRSEADLAHQAADAFRSYIRPRIPRFPPMRWILPLWRAIVWLLLRGKRKLLRQRRYDVAANHDVRIRFVGVWDTVSAYGGPFVELVRAFDDWIRPLTFGDRKLSPKVEIGRHALALDDERDAFHPVPWDEPWGTDRHWIRQVWFAGMHADVGGGYPDDSLAFVSLAWMMEEAAAAGLALRPEKVAEAKRTANAFGPIHDSRAGIKSYYRYQPRNVGAYLQPPAEGTASMVDPEYAAQGFSHRPWVHDSVVARIDAGSDRYAPITLPERFLVVDHDPEDSAIPPTLRDNLERTAAERADQQEAARDLVWWRRVLYFAIVGVSLLLASLPLWPARDPLCADARCFLATFYGSLDLLVPGFLEPWIRAFERFPTWFSVGVLLIFAFLGLGGSAERHLRDRTRLIWREALDGAIADRPTATPIRAFRANRLYQRLIALLKWEILPTIFGIAMLLGLLWLLLAAATQTRLAMGEGRGLFCAEAGPDPGPGMNFHTADPCNSIDLPVKAGQSYEVQLVVGEEWKDGNIATDPRGFASARFAGQLGYLAAPFRRVVGARWMQPLVMIDGKEWTPHVAVLELEKVGGKRWLGSFTAPRDGRLSLFVNEAVPPFGSASFFYDGSRITRNQGTACVLISRKLGDLRQPVVTC